MSSQFVDQGNELSQSARRVQEALIAQGVELNIVELPVSTRTANEAAGAVGCEVGQIAKSLVLRGEQSNRAYLVITSGSNRLDLDRLATQLTEPVKMANADFVRQRTGFSIGGVPPTGHSTPVSTHIDQDLLQFEFIWAAAGTPNAVFRLTPDQLIAIAGDQVIEVN
jgi:prolyl-tRNA editing enzyme YbaK/EbsC (Cys-tRNA(Pro) deacylase)